MSSDSLQNRPFHTNALETSPFPSERALCSSCQRMFIQPTASPADEEKLKFRLRTVDIAASAQAGCPLCVLVLARISSFRLRTSDVNRFEIEEMDCKLNWGNDCFGSLRYNIADQILNDFYIELYLDSIVSDIDQLRPPNTKSDDCDLLASRWLTNCLADHSKCRTTSEEIPWLPTRLIDIGTPESENPQIRLVESSNLRFEDPRPLYTTLSHRWAAEGVFQLTGSNLNALKLKIPLESLSPTFQDAIIVTRKLGARFLWIDSLCILQDSVDDWRAESAEMGTVYSHSLCNIAATANSDHGGGLFQTRDPRLITPYKTRIAFNGHDKTYCFFEANLWCSTISDSILNRRGWVFQERMLSPRTLHFANQMFWECRTLQVCETFPTRLPDELNIFADHKDASLPVTLKNWRDIGKDGGWSQVIEIYSNCELTRLEDRLIAIAGIAREVQPHLGDEYLAGLWKKELPQNLLWSFSNTGTVKRATSYRCPSWSWASLDFEYADIDFVPPGNIENILVNVIDTHVESTSGNIYGHLSTGYIKLEGRVDQVFSPQYPNVGEWLTNHSSYDFVLDVETYEDDEPLYCLPVAIYDDSPGSGLGLLTSCLLLKPYVGQEGGFVRVGIMTVALDSKEILPEELQWVYDFSVSDRQPLPAIMIY